MSKPKFRLEDYKGDYAMHCDTEEKAKTFLKLLAENGREWHSGAEYTKHVNFDIHWNNTVYYFNEGRFGDVRMNGKSIVLEFDDFDWSETPNNTKKIVITDNGIKSVAEYYVGDDLVCSTGLWHGKKTTFCGEISDFKTIFSNLIDEIPKDYYTGKVFCVDAPDASKWEKGKIYEFNNGFTMLKGERFPKHELLPITSFEDFKMRAVAEFMEVVE